jgi:hypothetical protein
MYTLDSKKNNGSNMIKQTFFWVLLMTLLTTSIYSGESLHRTLSDKEKGSSLFIWEEDTQTPFDELVISWNALRPRQGNYLIQVCVKTTEWSPWFDYAFWSSDDQYTFKHQSPDIFVQVYQDAVEILEGKKATAFKIRVLAKNDATLSNFNRLHISSIDRSTHSVDAPTFENVFINLDVAGLSQMALLDERCKRLCSPTSTTAVIHFLSSSSIPNPLSFADSIVDSAFDIYGNWILNVAQASHHLQKPWKCYVTRLSSFDQVIHQLQKGHPVVVSVKGPLKGGATPYESGHLLIVKGYDSDKKEVFCMDPAFSADELTLVKYDLNDFLTAWRRRQGLAYLFDQ